MRLLVYEYVTGGGMAGEDPPPSLVHEADLMVRTLIGELGALSGIEVLTTRDRRLPPVPGAEAIRVSPEENPLAHFLRGVRSADAVWPTAPETGGALETLAQRVLDSGRVHFGCAPAAINLAASKRRTSDRLREAGIAAVQTLRAPPLPDHAGPWVVKPDDGAGSERTVVVPDAGEALSRLASDPGLVAQPWIEGEALSLSLLAADGEARVLACNRQEIVIREGVVALRALAVNAIPDAASRFGALARRIAKAVPGLWGYVGVDFVLTPSGPVVLEINPRLTTSYCGLPQALGENIAARVLDLRRSGGFARFVPPAPGVTVPLVLEAARA